MRRGSRIQMLRLAKSSFICPCDHWSQHESLSEEWGRTPSKELMCSPTLLACSFGQSGHPRDIWQRGHVVWCVGRRKRKCHRAYRWGTDLGASGELASLQWPQDVWGQRRGEEGGVTIGGLALDYELNPHGSVPRVTNKIRIVLKSCAFFILDPVSLNPTLR